jgi:hypothetical protein
MCIDDEAKVLGHLVVQEPACGVGVVSLPVHALDAALFGRSVDGLDERSANSAAAGFLNGEEIL